MTREDSKKKLWSNGSINSLSKVECNDILDKVYDSFETQNKTLTEKISRLEAHRSCDGCKFEDYGTLSIQCQDCIRVNCLSDDRYEPKDN